MERITFHILVAGMAVTIVLSIALSAGMRPTPLDPAMTPEARHSPTQSSPSAATGSQPESRSTSNLVVQRTGDPLSKQESDPSGFPLPSLQGVMLGPSDYRGKVVLVNFWATWCGPCRREIADFLGLYSEYHSRGLEILGVSVDAQGAAIVRQYVGSAGINYPVLVGNPEVGRLYEVTAIPTTVVFDRKGKMSGRLVGAQSRKDLEALIKSLL
jgi:thiol-disulfide isomerase/thioredoxin